MVPPVLALVFYAPIGIPLIFELLGPVEVSPKALLWALPFVIGWLCVPGYTYTLFAQPRAQQVSVAQRWNVRLSLLGAMACATSGVVLGVLGNLMFELPTLMAFSSLLLSAYLLWGFERSGRDSKSPTEPEHGAENKPELFRSYRKEALKGVLLAICLFILVAFLWYLVLPKEYSDVHAAEEAAIQKSVVESSLKAYAIAKSGGDPIQMCAQVGAVVTAYEQAKDENNSKKWKAFESYVCQSKIATRP